MTGDIASFDSRSLTSSDSVAGYSVEGVASLSGVEPRLQTTPTNKRKFEMYDCKFRADSQKGVAGQLASHVNNWEKITRDRYGTGLPNRIPHLF